MNARGYRWYGMAAIICAIMMVIFASDEPASVRHVAFAVFAIMETIFFVVSDILLAMEDKP